MPNGRQLAVRPFVATWASTAVVIVIFVWVGHGLIGEVHDNYTCEVLDGYDPSGTTAAERYPPGTWAGLCEKNESGAAMLYGVLLGIGAVGLSGVCATIVHAISTREI